jgi:hypothetical protein
MNQWKFPTISDWKSFEMFHPTLRVFVHDPPHKLFFGYANFYDDVNFYGLHPPYSPLLVVMIGYLLFYDSLCNGEILSTIRRSIIVVFISESFTCYDSKESS